MTAERFFFVSVFLSLWCSGQKTFTVEEAVETIGFGRFHIMLFLIMGSTGVGVCSRLHWPEKILFSSSLLPCNNNYNHHGYISQPIFFTHNFSSRISAVVIFGQNQYGPQLISDLFQVTAEQIGPEHPGLAPALEHRPTGQH